MIRLNPKQGRVGRSDRAVQHRDGKVIEPGVFPDRGPGSTDFGDDAVIGVVDIDVLFCPRL